MITKCNFTEKRFLFSQRNANTGEYQGKTLTKLPNNETVN